MDALKNITISAPAVKEYRLMYFYGVWATSRKFYAETDAEAIFDADADFPEDLHKWTGVALWQGNRCVKTYHALPDMSKPCEFRVYNG